MSSLIVWNYRVMSWCDFIAGWVGGSAGLVCGHPMDTVKVLQQAGGTPSIMRVIYDTAKQEGFRGFLKGMFYPVMTAGAINSIFFGVYGVSMAKIQVWRWEYIVLSTKIIVILFSPFAIFGYSNRFC